MLLPTYLDRPALGLLWRVLAVADATFVQLLGVYWISTWPGRGDFLGTITTVILLFWALKRARRAIFVFDDYRWMVRHVVRWGTLLLVIGALMKAVTALPY